MRLRQTALLTEFGLVVVAVALTVAALLDAPLTWDGGYYLFRMLDTAEPLVTHDRYTDYALHLPVVWTMDLTNNQMPVRLVFNLLHVATPFVALGMSWMVVRRTAPTLFVWPALGIGLALLPGQMNFISEGIKSEQLMWPLLLAIVIGMPKHTWIPISLLIPTLTFFHPVTVPIFVACTLAALVHAWLQPESRRRLVALAVVLLAIAFWRFLGINSSYESQEMTWETQKRQWSNSSDGAPTVALAIGVMLAISILAWPKIPNALHHRSRIAQLGGVALSTAALMFWARDPANWWDSLEYRGPAFAVTMVGAGTLFVASIVRLKHPQAMPVQPYLSAALLIGFSMVTVVQSIAWHGVVQNMRTQLDAAGQACVAREDLEGYPFTPLNLWSTNAFSLLYQGQTPTKVSMLASDCHVANTTGEVFISDLGSPYRSEHIDLHALRSSLPTASVCTWRETIGWYQPDALIPDSWRWTEGTGTIEVTMEEPGMVRVRGEFRTLEAPNTIRVLVEGKEMGSFEVDGLGSEPFELMPVGLPAGTSTIRFVSDNPSAVVPNDDRLLAISVWNLTIRPADGSSPCIKQAEPAG